MGNDARMVTSPHPASTSGIHKLRVHLSARREQATTAEYEGWLDEVARRLSDQRRIKKGPLLSALRAVGMEQLVIQTIGAGSQDTQAGIVLAGSAALATFDSTLPKTWELPLIAALAAAVVAIIAVLLAKPEGGPPLSKLIDRRFFIDQSGREIVLDDDEAEWILVGDIEVAVDRNARQLARRGRMISLAMILLVIGVADLVGLEAL
jgi:hypothetical protein